jgi:hypothetical protein
VTATEFRLIIATLLSSNRFGWEAGMRPGLLTNAHGGGYDLRILGFVSADVVIMRVMALALDYSASDEIARRRWVGTASPNISEKVEFFTSPERATMCGFTAPVA